MFNELDEANAEIERLKDIIREMELPQETKVVRFQQLKTKDGLALVVTDPRGDEQKLAEDVAGYVNLLNTVAESLKWQKLQQQLADLRAENQQLKESHKTITVSAERLYDLSEGLIDCVKKLTQERDESYGMLQTVHHWYGQNQEMIDVARRVEEFLSRRSKT